MIDRHKLTPQEFTLQAAFGAAWPHDHTIMGYAPSECEFIPRADANWHWDRAILRDLTAWWSEGGSDPLYLFGPTGAGKSRAIVNFCAALNIPLYERTIFNGLEFADLVTQVDLVDGNTLTSYGLLPLAMGADGLPGIFCANEVDRADEGMLTGLYEVLEGRPLITNVGGADIVRPVSGFRFVATGNTTMRGDHTGLYSGTRQQDIAFLDRFWKIKATYLPKDAEAKLLKAIVPHLPERLIQAMVEVANDIRGAFMGDSDSASALPLTMSTRTLLRWAKTTWTFRAAEANGISPIYYALDRAFLNAADGDTAVRMAITKIVEGRLGQDAGVGHG